MKGQVLSLRAPGVWHSASCRYIVLLPKLPFLALPELELINVTLSYLGLFSLQYRASGAKRNSSVSSENSWSKVETFNSQHRSAFRIKCGSSDIMRKILFCYVPRMPGKFKEEWHSVEVLDLNSKPKVLEIRPDDFDFDLRIKICNHRIVHYATVQAANPELWGRYEVVLLVAANEEFSNFRKMP